MGGGEDGKGRRSDIWQVGEYVILQQNINALHRPIVHRLVLRPAQSDNDSRTRLTSERDYDVKYWMYSREAEYR